MKISLILIIAVVFTSCDNLLDIKPRHVVPTEKAFNDVDSYQMALNNVFRMMTSSTMNMQTADYASDDFANVIPGYAPSNYTVFNWDYKSQPQPYVWVSQYQLISQENVLIDNYDLVLSENKTEQERIDKIYAQALGLRALALFNVAQLYAPLYNGKNPDAKGIPLKLKLALEYLPAATLKQVYDQIYNDLDKALKLFKSSSYSPSSTDKPYQFGIDAVHALYARVALFIGDLEKAKKESSNFINISLLPKDDYWMLWEDDFTSENKEVIFMTHNLSDTDDADLIDYHEIYITNQVHLDKGLINSFSATDVRKDVEYIDKNNIPSKYVTPVNNRNKQSSRDLNYKYFRVAEQYLIYAESVLKSDPSAALRILNKLKLKRGANVLTVAPTKDDILKERRRELFTEGLRFYDLKRLSATLNIVVRRNNGKVLNPGSSKYVWDIPKEETNSNSHFN